MEKSAIVLAYLLIKLINKQGGIFRLLHEKVERKSEKSKRPCSSIRDFRLNGTGRHECKLVKGFKSYCFSVLTAFYIFSKIDSETSHI